MDAPDEAKASLTRYNVQQRIHFVKPLQTKLVQLPVAPHLWDKIWAIEHPGIPYSMCTGKGAGKEMACGGWKSCVLYKEWRRVTCQCGNQRFLGHSTMRAN